MQIPNSPFVTAREESDTAPDKLPAPPDPSFIDADTDWSAPASVGLQPLASPACSSILSPKAPQVQSSSSTSANEELVRKDDTWSVLRRITRSPRRAANCMPWNCFFTTSDSEATSTADPSEPKVPRHLRREIYKSLAAVEGPYKPFSERIALEVMLRCSHDYWAKHPPS